MFFLADLIHIITIHSKTIMTTPYMFIPKLLLARLQ